MNAPNAPIMEIYGKNEKVVLELLEDEDEDTRQMIMHSHRDRFSLRRLSTRMRYTKKN